MILPGMRRLLIIFSGLTLLAFAVLFVGAGQTDRYFAWTINPPATAAFLGGAYAGGCALVVIGMRRGTWAAMRIPYITILVFTLVTLAATLLHLDKFHFAKSGVALFAAWFWLAIYVFVPLAMIIVLIGQVRRPVPEPARRLPIPRPLAAALGIQGGIFLAVGEDDLARLEVSAAAYALLAGLEIVVLVRYAGVVRWTAPATWVYLALFMLIMVCAAYALPRIRRESAAEARYSP